MPNDSISITLCSQTSLEVQSLQILLVLKIKKKLLGNVTSYSIHPQMIFGQVLNKNMPSYLSIAYRELYT